MVTLLHGDNIVASRKKLEELVSAFIGEVVRFEGKNIDKTELAQALDSNALFAAKRLVVIEENVVEGLASDRDIIFWLSKAATATQLKSLAEVVNLEFKTPLSIFRLTDSLRPKNGKQLIELYCQCLAESEAEFIFAMIIRQFRLMLDSTQIKQEWQAAKVRVQAKSFGEARLKEIYSQLLEIDWKSKNSLLAGGLSGTLKELLAWM